MHRGRMMSLLPKAGEHCKGWWVVEQPANITPAHYHQLICAAASDQLSDLHVMAITDKCPCHLWWGPPCPAQTEHYCFILHCKLWVECSIHRLHGEMEGTGMLGGDTNALMAEKQETDSPMVVQNESASTSGRDYFTRSKMLTEHKAAGVLPLCVHRTGPVFVLLGAEDCRTGPAGCVIKTMCKPSAHLLSSVGFFKYSLIRGMVHDIDCPAC